MNEISRRDLTEQEIKDLPVDLKLCFMIQGWNVSANIKSVDDWITEIGFLQYEDMECDFTIDDSRNRCRKDIYKKLEFFHEYILSPVIDHLRKG